MKVRYYRMVYLLCLAYCFLVDNRIAYAQVESIHALLEQLKAARGKDKVDVLNKVGNHYLHDYPQQAVTYFREAVSLGRETRHRMGQADALHKTGMCLIRAGEYPEAKAHLLQAQEIFFALNDADRIAETYNTLSEYYSKRGDTDSAEVCLQKALHLPGKKSKKTDAQSYYLLGFQASYRGDSDKALAYFQNSLKISTENNDKLSQAIAYEGMGFVFRRKGKAEEGLAAFGKALKLLIPLGQKTRMASCYNGIGQLFGETGDFDKVLENQLKSLTIYEELDNKYGISFTLNNLGGVHLLRENYDEAISYFRRALKMQEELGNKRSQAGIYSNMGLACYATGKYAEARNYYKRAMVIAEELGIRESIAILSNSMALVHLKTGKYDSALLLFEKYLALGEQMQDEGALAEAYKNIGWLHVKMKQPVKALTFLEKAKTLAEGNGAKDLLKDVYSHLSEAYAEMKDYEKSLACYKLFTTLKDSLYGEQKNKVIAEMEAKYELEKKNKELAQNNVTLQKQKLSLTQKQYSIAALMLVIVILIVLGLLLRVRAKKQKLLLRLEYEEKHARIRQQLELAQLRSDFFTNISHEFRTPLTLVLTPLQQMMQHAKDESLRQQYELMVRNADRLLTMVNQILDLSKIESGHDALRVGRYNILGFMREIINSFSVLVEVSKVQTVMINELEDPFLFFDREKLEKVFYNILANAFRHTSPGGMITIYLKANEISPQGFDMEFPDGSVTISVKDSGNGIPEEHLPYIFNRFYQVDKHAQNGSGIGLALTKEIVELHGGIIDVKSQPGEGTEFIITLPSGKAHFSDEEIADKDDADASGGPHESGNMFSKKFLSKNEVAANGRVGVSEKKDAKVLVIEDNEDLLQYIRNLMSVEYEVITATNGHEGVQQTALHHPELIICDVMMPGMNGYEVTRSLKSDIATSHIPVVLLTAKAEQKYKITGLETGADDYISKPFHADELLVRSRNLIDQRRKLRKLFSEMPLSTSATSYNTTDQRFLDKTMKIVTDHIDDPDFDVEKFCREIGMSHTSLHNKLKALTDQSVTQFVRCVRLKKAAKLIEQDAGSMADIAALVGFNSRQFFIRSFKEQFGMTPTEYKANTLKKGAAANGR